MQSLYWNRTLLNLCGDRYADRGSQLTSPIQPDRISPAFLANKLPFAIAEQVLNGLDRLRI